VTVVIRVDASAAIGAGHLMRCLALAAALQRQGATIRFVTGPLPEPLGTLITSAGYESAIVDAPGSVDAMPAAMAGRRWNWLVVDHYGLDARWESAMRAHADRIAVIDDHAGRVHDCDLLVDQNLQPDGRTPYAGLVPPTALTLLGPDYALLRGEFVAARAQARPRTGPVRRLLIAFGGGNSGGATRAAVDAVADCDGRPGQVDVVIGAADADRAAIEGACAEHGYVSHVQPDALAAMMTAADLAIGAAGSMTWERCCVGLPAAAAAIAGNQQPVLERAAQARLIQPIAGAVTRASVAAALRALLRDEPLRTELSRNGLATVDGRGADRVARAMSHGPIVIRPAIMADAAAMFTWRNDETVRRSAWQTGAIAWPIHEAWVAATLASADRHLLVAEAEGVPIGVLRFDVSGADAEVSLYRVPGSGRPGAGAPMLLAGERWLHARRPEVTAISATVRPENAASHRLFRACGYQPSGQGYRKQVRAA
jgi:UDP-2,4-diacetamido-2,4,6-trideoxy-beta-L-altropyranose hydrolase